MKNEKTLLKIINKGIRIDSGVFDALYWEQDGTFYLKTCIFTGIFIGSALFIDAIFSFFNIHSLFITFTTSIALSSILYFSHAKNAKRKNFIHLLSEKQKNSKDPEELGLLLLDEFSKEEISKYFNLFETYFLKFEQESKSINILIYRIAKDYPFDFFKFCLKDKETTKKYISYLETKDLFKIVFSKRFEEIIQNNFGTGFLIDLKENFIIKRLDIFIALNDTTYDLEIYEFLKMVNCKKGAFFELEERLKSKNISLNETDDELNQDIHRTFKNQSVYNF